MSIAAIISAERERYVSHFETAVREASAANPSSARELLISLNNDTLDYPYRYLRVDLIEKAEDGTDRISEIWLDSPSNFEATGVQLGPVTIELYSFTWCATQIAFNQPLPDPDRLAAFLTGWLDVSDANSTPSGAAGAIHSATPVETNGQLWYLTVDLGTAPADALLDLIDFLGNEGMANRIIVTSHPR